MNASYRRILMIHPEFSDSRTYWGMQYFLPLIGKKGFMPSLGLITIAGMTPPEYEIRLVDLNCEPLTEEDLAWADMVCFSAMRAQQQGLFQAAQRCKAAGKLVVFGGPFPTASPEECRPFCDVLVLNEGEITWPAFLRDLKEGQVRDLYTSEVKPDLSQQAAVPRFDLLKVQDYALMPIQFMRGCPFQCEFCDITVMFGRRPRPKTAKQFLAELDAIRKTGYRGGIFVVDDNFIGNKKEVMKLLPELKAWNEAHGHPFYYGTEASLNLADDKLLMKMMVECDLLWVFVGIETPSIESLKETKKFQNVTGSLLDRVKAIQNAGFLIYGGGIVGFDSDTEDIFDRQIEFVTQAAIPNVQISPLVALPGTPLYARMKQEGRLLESNDYTRVTFISSYTNIQTKIPLSKLLQGYRKIIQTIYTPQAYFGRTIDAFSRLPRPASLIGRLKKLFWLGSIISKNFTENSGNGTGSRASLMTRLKYFWGIFQKFPEDFRRESMRFIWAVLRKRPEQLPRVLGYILMGYHYYKFTFDQLVPEINMYLAEMPGDFLESKKVA